MPVKLAHPIGDVWYNDTGTYEAAPGVPFVGQVNLDSISYLRLDPEVGVG